MSKNLAKKILEANIEYHSKMGKEYSKQPHYKKETVIRVEKIIKKLASQTSGKRLLDIGCGSGFIIDIAKRYFDEVVGVDITSAMLQQVKKAKNVRTILADSSKLPLEDNYFDVCTSFLFLHHLYKIEPAIKEAHRVLKKGGIYYNDKDPNYYFFLKFSQIPPRNDFSETMKQEIFSLTSQAENYKSYRINKEILDLAEYQRMYKLGFEEEELSKILHKIGFKKIDIFYDWYAGQGKIIKRSPKLAQDIDSYLRELLPASRDLYKYLGFLAQK
ncbi:hypothetical protein A2V71_03625 [Candidatus Berkelbacteria bacterium RBG_13_40_8]|uniref:Methyltransferase type 11 domain-containing protein n=1 Tax=Candidatus Berkelbacteria bacterium RBG_13_40_8 TaxID=1797467 RepID=A0A1F5DNE4_9BACT|nr:MAG: hypothetical protein A2V71_03625 [Candidatus Berkelbacteria bacterium RBG_13_40_8]